MSNTIFPKEKSDGLGWTISFAFLQAIEKEISIYDDTAGLGAIENILLSQSVVIEIKKLQHQLEVQTKRVEERLALAMKIIEEMEVIQRELIAVADVHLDDTFEKIKEVEEMKVGLR